MNYNLTFETNFTVFPHDTNYMDTLFGGKLMKEMDICAGMTAKRFLYDSPDVEKAVTAHVDAIDFSVPAHVGDIVHLRGEIVDTGESSMDIEVKAIREKGPDGERVTMCTANFVFVSVEEGRAKPHNLSV